MLPVVYREFDENNNGLDFDEFFECCEATFSAMGSRAPREEILEDYFYDYDKDGSGKLNYKEFKKLMKHMVKDHKKSGKKHGRKYSDEYDDYSDFDY